MTSPLTDEQLKALRSECESAAATPHRPHWSDVMLSIVSSLITELLELRAERGKDDGKTAKNTPALSAAEQAARRPLPPWELLSGETTPPSFKTGEVTILACAALSHEEKRGVSPDSASSVGGVKPE